MLKAILKLSERADQKLSFLLGRDINKAIEGKEPTVEDISKVEQEQEALEDQLVSANEQLVEVTEDIFNMSEDMELADCAQKVQLNTLKNKGFFDEDSEDTDDIDEDFLYHAGDITIMREQKEALVAELVANFSETGEVSVDEMIVEIEGVINGD